MHWTLFAFRPAPSALADSYSFLANSYFRSAMVLAVWVASHQFFLEALFSAAVTVGLMYIGGTHVLTGTLSVGALYAMLRYTAIVEQGYTALSEGVARFYASYGGPWASKHAPPCAAPACAPPPPPPRPATTTTTHTHRHTTHPCLAPTPRTRTCTRTRTRIRIGNACCGRLDPARFPWRLPAQGAWSTSSTCTTAAKSQTAASPPCSKRWSARTP